MGFFQFPGALCHYFFDLFTVYYMRCGFRAGHKYTIDSAIIIVNRAIAEGPVNIFHAPVAVKGHQLVFKENRDTRGDYLLYQGTNKFPYLRPYFFSLFAYGRMLSLNSQAGTKG